MKNFLLGFILGRLRISVFSVVAVIVVIALVLSFYIGARWNR